MQNHTTWYQPFDDAEHIQQAINFALSQDISGICTAGDTTILPLILDACERFSPMNKAEQEKLIASAEKFEPLFS